MPGYAFKFLSGKYQGGEFELPEVGEVVIGRAADVDMVLVEDMVSRRHARMVATGGQLALTDLGSTNGTFVNGEKIEQVRLYVGDRVLIGTAILKLIESTRSASDPDHDPALEGEAITNTQVDHRAPFARPAANAMQAMIANLPAGPKASATTMSGELEELPLPDLLLLFATNRKSGRIAIEGPMPAVLLIRDGELMQARIVQADAAQTQPMQPMQALCKMVTWTQGTFVCEPLKEGEAIAKEFEASTENCLFEAMRRNDEAQRAASQLAAGHGRVNFVLPLGAKLSALNPDMLETLQLAINHGDIAQIVTLATSSPDTTVAHLQQLLDGGYLASGAP